MYALYLFEGETKSHSLNKYGCNTLRAWIETAIIYGDTTSSDRRAGTREKKPIELIWNIIT